MRCYEGESFNAYMEVWQPSTLHYFKGMTKLRCICGKARWDK